MDKTWKRKWQPTPVLLPGKFHGWRSLVGYNPWGHKESDKTEQLHFHFQNKLLKKNKIKWTKDHEDSPYHYSVCLCVLSRIRLCNPMDCSLLDSSVHGILPARVMEWVAISSSRDLPPLPRDVSSGSCTGGQIHYC